MDYAIEFLISAWAVVQEMAPFLLLGFAAAGLLHVLVQRGLIERLMGGRGLGAIVKAALVGVPLPICSCGVIPLAASLREKGASKGATTSFLISTPETGADSILATYALLGPIFMVYRVVVAFVTGTFAGVMVSLFDRDDSAGSEPVVEAEACCGSVADPEASCCGEDEHADISPTLRARMLEALRFGFVTLPQDIARPLVLGIVIAAAIAVLVEQDYLGNYLDNGVWTMLLMMAVGIPLYVCSTASIPIAVGFLHAGISPGAALVFLVVGPATNAATISVVWKMLGRRTLAVYLISIAGAAFVAGLSLDALYAFLDTAPALPQLTHEHPMGGIFNIIAGVVLILLLFYGARPQPKQAPCCAS